MSGQGTISTFWFTMVCGELLDTQETRGSLSKEVGVVLSQRNVGKRNERPWSSGPSTCHYTATYFPEATGRNSGLHKAGGSPISFKLSMRKTTFPMVSQKFGSIVISLLLLAAV